MNNSANSKIGPIIAIVVGLILLGSAIIYFTESASALPGFLPGHEAGVATKHVKHGILSLALAVIAFLVAWFQSGPKANAAK